MLIRSSDREELINLDVCHLTVVGGDIRAYSLTNENTYTSIGKYSDKNRSIEVLDEIVGKYMSVGARSGMMHNEVFQMPKE